jgi:hypothetical protein
VDHALVQKIETLARLGIQASSLEGLDRHVVFWRDGYAALVERRENGFGKVGTAGLVTAQGLAMLVWRGEQPFFVARGFEEPATAEQVEGARRLNADLAQALSDSG